MIYSTYSHLWNLPILVEMDCILSRCIKTEISAEFFPPHSVEACLTTLPDRSPKRELKARGENPKSLRIFSPASACSGLRYAVLEVRKASCKGLKRSHYDHKNGSKIAVAMRYALNDVSRPSQNCHFRLFRTTLRGAFNLEACTSEGRRTEAVKNENQSYQCPLVVAVEGKLSFSNKHFHFD